MREAPDRNRTELPVDQGDAISEYKAAIVEFVQEKFEKYRANVERVDGKEPVTDKETEMLRLSLEGGAKISAWHGSRQSRFEITGGEGSPYYAVQIDEGGPTRLMRSETEWARDFREVKLEDLDEGELGEILVSVVSAEPAQ